MRERVFVGVLAALAMCVVAGCPNPGTPVLRVSTTELNYVRGEMVKTFEVWNGGTGRLFFDVEANRSWIHVDPMVESSMDSEDKVTISVTLQDGEKVNDFFQGAVRVTASTGAMRVVDVTAGVDTFTEVFSQGAFDLANTTLTFAPDPNVSFNYYLASVDTGITALPTDTAGANVLNDSFEVISDPLNVEIRGGDEVMVYGESYGSLAISSDGYVILGDSTPEARSAFTTESHFERVGVSAFFSDLDPGTEGDVLFQQLDDRVCLTWLEVASVGEPGTSTFQLELFYNGQIRLSFLNVSAYPGIVGLSAGVEPAQFLASDLSSYPEEAP